MRSAQSGRRARCRRRSASSTARFASGSRATSSRASRATRGSSARGISPPARSQETSARRRSAESSTVARSVGIRFFGTGGIGGVHRGYPTPPDVSADLVALALSPVLVACSGAKSLLDIPATMEHLETLGIPVLGYRTDTLPLFYSATGGPPVPQRVDDAETAAAIAAAHWQLGGCGLLLANPPPESIDVERPDRGGGRARRPSSGVSGQAVTPFVLAFLHERSGGRTREVNRELAIANARLAGEVAVAFAAL